MDVPEGEVAVDEVDGWARVELMTDEVGDGVKVAVPSSTVKYIPAIIGPSPLLAT